MPPNSSDTIRPKKPKRPPSRRNSSGRASASSHAPASGLRRSANARAASRTSFAVSLSSKSMGGFAQNSKKTESARAPVRDV